jgi:hypothetical protein
LMFHGPLLFRLFHLTFGVRLLFDSPFLFSLFQISGPSFLRLGLL